MWTGVEGMTPVWKTVQAYVEETLVGVCSYRGSKEKLYFGGFVEAELAATSVESLTNRSGTGLGSCQEKTAELEPLSEQTHWVAVLNPWTLRAELTVLAYLYHLSGQN